MPSIVKQTELVYSLQAANLYELHNKQSNNVTF